MAGTPADVAQLMITLNSPDNQVRGAAEQQLKAIQAHPEFLLPALCTVIAARGDPAGTVMAAVVLRKSLTFSKQADMYNALSPETATRLRGMLLELLVQTGTSPPLRRSINGCISTLGCRLLTPDKQAPGVNKWPELLPFLFEATQSGAAEHICSVLDIMSTLTTVLLDTQVFRDNVQTIGELFNSALTHNTAAVRTSAVEATCSVVKILSTEDYLAPFTSLVPPLMNCVSMALNGGSIDDAHDLINNLTTVAEANSTYFAASGMLPNIFDAMFTVAETAQFDAQVRHIAIEFMVSYSESDPRKAKKVPGFVARIVPLLMRMMLTPGDLDNAEWGNTIEDEEEVSDYDVGLEGLDRLAVSIGGATFEKPLSAEILKYLQQGPQDWRCRNVAILALSQTAEGCRKQFEPNLASLVAKVLEHFGDEHPRVRFTAVQCIAQFCTDFQPEFQSVFADLVVPAVTKMLHDPVPRIRHHAAAAIVNFCDEAQPSLYERHVEPLLVTLYQILDNRSEPLFIKEQVLSSVSAVAENCTSRFAKFYDNFMPVMKSIIALPEQNENRMVKGRAIECASFMAVAAGREMFGAQRPGQRSDSDIIMGYMYELNQRMEADDPRSQYLLQAWTRLAECIGPLFAQYLDAVMPSLVTRLTNTDDVSVLDEDEEVDAEDDDVQCIRLAVKGHSEKKLAIRTSLLEEKTLALSMLISYFNTLGETMLPWVERLARAVIPLVQNPYLEEIRESSAKLCPLMLMCLKKNAEAGRCPPDAVTQLLLYVVPQMDEALRCETEAGVAGCIMENLHESIDTCGRECLTPDFLTAMLKTLKEMFEESLERRCNIAKDHADVEGDEDEQAKLDEQADAEENLLSACVETVGKLIKTHPQTFMPMFTSTFLPFFTQMLDTQKFSSLEHKLSLCMLDDFVEFGDDAVTPFFGDIGHALCQFASTEDPDVLQACTYGLGILAQWVAAKPGRAWPAGLIEKGLATLQGVVAKQLGPNDDIWYAPMCNAVSSLLKFLRLFRGQAGISEETILPSLFPQLPVQGDAIEAQIVHQEIFALVGAKNPVVIGPGGSNLPAIKAIAQKLVESDPDDEPLINAATRVQLQQFLMS